MRTDQWTVPNMALVACWAGGGHLESLIFGNFVRLITIWGRDLLEMLEIRSRGLAS